MDRSFNFGGGVGAMFFQPSQTFSHTKQNQMLFLDMKNL